MMEWQIVTVIGTLVAMGAAVITPIVKLNTSITKLTATVEHLGKQLADEEKKNADSHDRLWRKEEEQDATLDDHEHRITILEVKK